MLAVHRLRLLPLRPHRRPHPIQACPGTSAGPGSTRTTPRPGPLGAGVVSVRRRADRPRPRCACRLLGRNGFRASEASSADIENLGFERGHRTLRIVGKGNKPAIIPLVPRTARTIDLAIGNVPLVRSCSATTAADLTGIPVGGGGSVRPPSEPASTTSTRACCVRRSPCAPRSGRALRPVEDAVPSCGREVCGTVQIERSPLLCCWADDHRSAGGKRR